MSGRRKGLGDTQRTDPPESVVTEEKTGVLVEVELRRDRVRRERVNK